MNVSFISAPNAVHQHYPIQPAGIGGGSPKSYTGPMRLRNVSNTAGTLTVTKSFHPSSGAYQLNLEYSTDGENWDTCGFNSDVFSVQVPAGGYVCFRGDNPRGITADDKSARTVFSMDVQHVAEGKLTTLISKASYSEVTSLERYAFHHMFLQNTNLVTAENLSFDNVTTLGSTSYMGPVSEMFSGCSALTTPPDMSGITDVAGINAGYKTYTMNGMFSGCSSLTTPAKIYNVVTVSSYPEPVFGSMYSRCSNLSYVYVANVAGLSYEYYQSFLYNAGTSVSGDKIIYCPTQAVYDAFPKTDTRVVPAGWTVQVMQ